MLAARGIIVSHETIRPWARSSVGSSPTGSVAPVRGDKCHLDEVVITIAGKKHWLWRAVDQLLRRMS